MKKSTKINKLTKSFHTKTKILAALLIANLFTALLIPMTEIDSESKIGIQAGQPIDDFGNILITDDVADRIAATNAKWVRVNMRLGPHPYDTEEFYQSYEEIFDRLEQRGLKIIALASNETVAGSQEEWTENNNEHNSGSGMNSYIERYSESVERLVERFPGIRYWEIWNEPNAFTEQDDQGHFWGGTFLYPSNFAAMITDVYARVKFYKGYEGNIIWGGVLGHDINGYTSADAGADYLDQVYEMGLNKTGQFKWAQENYGVIPGDSIGQHIYIHQGGPLNPEDFSLYLDLVHDVVVRREGPESQKKTHVTEGGWPTVGSLDEATQRDNLIAADHIINTKPFVQSYQWFKLDDSPGLDYGLYYQDGQAKEALVAFTNLGGGYFAALRDEMGDFFLP